MAVLQMQRISICALKQHRKMILERLQELGWLEINLDLEEDESYEKLDTTGAKNAFQKRMHLADRALEVLGDYAAEKSSLLAGLAGRPLLDGDIYEIVASKRSKYSKTANELVAMDKEVSVQKARILKLENQMEELEPWINLTVAMDTSGTKKSSFFVGTLPSVMDESQILAELAKTVPELEAFTIEVLTKTKDMTYLAVVCLKRESRNLEDALRQIGFARPSRLISRTPAEEKVLLETEIGEARAQIGDLSQKIIALADEREHLRLMSDYYRVRAEKYEILGKLPQTRNVFAIGGYIPQKCASALAEEMKSKYDAVVEVEEIKEEEEAPVILQNHKFAWSGEGVLTAFGLPHKGEIDPSFIMTVFYVFLFGLMLSDAAYGMIVSIACGVALLKFPRMGTSMKKSLQLFFWCGLSTVFWGFLFGGFFGDAIDIIAQTFFGVTLAEGETLLPALWFVPLNDPMKMLVYSMLFGCIHMFTGLALKGYMCLKDKDYMGFLCDVVFWTLMLLGLIFMLLPSSLFESISQIKFVFPEIVNLMAKAFAIAGAVGILLFSGRGKKNWVLRIALGAYDLYNITGWLSDVLSYSRLLALGLATGVIASVINQMGSMVGGGVVGAIIFAVIFIAGHALNLGINLLGAYVHTCRLQYVEFFGKFYEGGGREFKPFHADTKYVDIEGGN